MLSKHAKLSVLHAILNFVVTLVTETGRKKYHPLVLYHTVSKRQQKGWRGNCFSLLPNMQELNSD